MEWHDDAIILSLRRHGEHDARLEVLSPAQGRVFGLVKGGYSRRQRGNLQPGNQVKAQWRARLESQLGHFTVELTRAHALALSRDALVLETLAAAMALASATLPEREPHPQVTHELAHVINLMDAAGDTPTARIAWLAAYVHWEMGLLSDLGFGLDLSECAATGVTENLVYVSPKSARAVSAEAGRPYHDRMLPLPKFLRDGGTPTLKDVADGLTLTGYFLDVHVLSAHGAAMPQARLRLRERVASLGGEGLE
jgi:DNA repair protein RecO (recombination protein O)